VKQIVIFPVVVFWVIASIAIAAHADGTPGPATVERILWKKAPIKITLPVGRERMVTFPGTVRVGIPSEITALLRTQGVKGVVYWLAGSSFETSRVQVHNVETGDYYLIDLKAVDDKKTSAAPIEIISDPSAIRRSGSTAVVAQHQSRPTGKNTEQDYVTLTRFAAQQLYASKRLLNTPPGVFRAGVGRKPVALLRGSHIEAIPLVAWRSGRLYVTAVRLRNLSHHPVTLDPRALRGKWLTATFQHARLFEEGDEADTTALYLISERPFEESLPW